MRIKVNYTKNTLDVPNNQSVVNSYIHNTLGRNNEYHGTKPKYNISGMLGGTIINGGRDIKYPNGGYMLVSSIDMDFINMYMNNVRINPNFGFGMTFKSFEILNEDFYNGWNYFKTTSMGFIIKKYNESGQQEQFHTLNDANFSTVVKEHLIKKLKALNPKLDLTDFDVKIPEHKSHVVKRKFVKNVRNDVNICKVEIFTNKKVAEYIYNFGIGQSTGSGFGTVYTMQYHDSYYNDFKK